MLQYKIPQWLLLVLIVSTISATADERMRERHKQHLNLNDHDDTFGDEDDFYDIVNDGETWLWIGGVSLAIIALLIICCCHKSRKRNLEQNSITDNLVPTNQNQSAAPDQSGSSYIPPMYNSQLPQYQPSYNSTQDGFINNAYPSQYQVQYAQPGVMSQGPHYESSGGIYPVLPSIPHATYPTDFR